MIGLMTLAAWAFIVWAAFTLYGQGDAGQMAAVVGCVIWTLSTCVLTVIGEESKQGGGA